MVVWLVHLDGRTYLRPVRIPGRDGNQLRNGRSEKRLGTLPMAVFCLMTCLPSPASGRGCPALLFRLLALVDTGPCPSAERLRPWLRTWPALLLPMAAYFSRAIATRPLTVLVEHWTAGHVPFTWEAAMRRRHLPTVTLFRVVNSASDFHGATTCSTFDPVAIRSRNGRVRPASQPIPRTLISVVHNPQAELLRADVMAPGAQPRLDHTQTAPTTVAADGHVNRANSDGSYTSP